MKFHQKICLLAACLAAFTCVGLALPQGGGSSVQAAPLTPILTPPNGGPIWRDEQDIGNGCTLQTITGFCKVLTDPANSASVRPVSLHLGFLYGVGLMTQFDYLDLQPASGTAAVEFRATLDRNVVVGTRPPFATLNYVVHVSPKLGYNWGNVQGAIHLDIVATQLP